MDSDLHHGHQHFQQQQQQQQQMNSGLTRYKSAPSSYFANLLNSVNFEEDDCDEVFNPSVSSPETDRIFQRFLSSGVGSDPLPPPEQQQQSLSQVRGDGSAVQPQFVGSMKHEQEDFQSHQQQQLIFQSQSQQQGHITASTSAMNDSFFPPSSMAMDRLPPMKMGGGSLVRQSSSPAGFLSHFNVDNAYSVIGGMGNFGTGGGGDRTESSFPSAKRLKNQRDFSSGPPCSLGLLTRIPEIDSKNMGISNSDDGSLDDTQRKDEPYVSGFGRGSWDDSSILPDDFLNGIGDSNRSTFPNMDLSESQNDEGRRRPPSTLAHHLSLPTSSSELSAMEKLMQFQDSVPLRSRAKRGCATHPRSIAERVRRTRISERMKKLQELVPNMDKQTNTSDMLDFAVDYIKDLQKQVETISEKRAKCTCSNKQNS